MVSQSHKFHRASRLPQAELKKPKEAPRRNSIHQTLPKITHEPTSADTMDLPTGNLFPAYTHLKRITNDWTSPDSLEYKTNEICSCERPSATMRQVDLIDMLGQKRVIFSFCFCTPDAVQILAHGYL
ncbi:hypothetical protein PCANC_08618 [Puccinia coronata f. sp. avenae]|uniref:CxC1-like cysteine cluster associated with KDZ transposases domain-containing protein n=1 Tax=Puccinia coronata f. sp. avenae TaxID=200324 RepID=A0A2N5UXN1_9BASI|nr:hypothetical protein PCANC_08618 [Puccinia coronata f. sp. avenae]